MRRTRQSSRTHAQRLCTWLNMGLEKEVAWDFSAASSLAASRAFSKMRIFTLMVIYHDGDKVARCMTIPTSSSSASFPTATSTWQFKVITMLFCVEKAKTNYAEI